MPAMQRILIAASRAEAIGPAGRLKVEWSGSRRKRERADETSEHGVRRPRAGPTL
ncbi:hypothetical protein GCM10027288_12230 [Bordetella tumbae]